MVHGDAVANGDSIDLEGYTAGGADARFYRLSDFTQMGMTGDDFAKAVHDTDEWFS
jgi:hypothetical protein